MTSTDLAETTYTAFHASCCIASGEFPAVAAALQAAQRQSPEAMPLAFRDDTGELIDPDALLRQSDRVSGGMRAAAASAQASPEKGIAKTRGRPRLGVVAREVTLLPEHWDWLAAQPGGASVGLRKLVHEARKAGAGRERRRQAQERAYRAMSALAGNLPGFEEASRALFAGKPDRLASEARAWPPDVLGYVLRLAGPALKPDAS